MLLAEEAVEGEEDTPAVSLTTSPEGGDQFTEFGEPAPTLLSMEFEDANLKDVLKTFSQQTGINVIASEDIGDRTLTLYLDEVTVLDALDQILAASHLTYERPPGSDIYVVRAKPAADPSKVATLTRVYRLRYARVSTSKLAKAVEAFGSITPFEAQKLTAALGDVGGGGAGGGGGVAGGAGGGGGGGGVGGEEEVGIDKVIEELLTDHGNVTVDERTNSLVVTDVPENFPRIEVALSALDIRTTQVLIEAEILETTLTKVKNLGVKWGSSSGVLTTFTPPSRTTAFPWNIDNLFGNPGRTKSSVTVGTINSAQAAAVLEALERDGDTKILARPKILTLDHESAVIRLTTQQAIGIESVTVSESGNVIQTPERSTTGVLLVVTPQVNEGGYVTLLVEPSVTGVVTSQISSTIVDPKTRSARSLVRIRQGETLVMGGLIDRTEKDTKQRVPVLSGVPLIGGAFKHKAVDETATELIVFVTPHVLPESPSGSQIASASLPTTISALSGVGQSERSMQAPEAVPGQGIHPARGDLMEETLERLE